MNSLDKIYGCILLSDKVRQGEFYSKIRTIWNVEAFHKNLHSIMGDMILQGQDINPMSLIHAMKNNNTFKQEYVIRLSMMSSVSQQVIHVNSLLIQLENEYQIRMAVKLKDEINTDIVDGVFTRERYIDKLQKSLNASLTINEKIETNQELILEILNRHDKAKSGIPVGLELGYRSIKNKVIVEDVDLMIIGARPAMGKTAFMVQTTLNMSRMYKQNILVFSLEMSKIQMLRRYSANIAQIDSNKMKFGQLNPYEEAKIMNVANNEDLARIHIYEGSHTLADITAITLELNAKIGISCVWVDYLQKVTPSKGKRSRHEEVSEISGGLKSISQNLKIPVISLAQLSRDGADGGRRPGLTHLKESGDMEQDASIVGFLHRPEYYGKEMTDDGIPSNGVCELLIGKNREGEVGVYLLNTVFPTSSFSDYDSDSFTSMNDFINNEF